MNAKMRLKRFLAGTLSCTVFALGLPSLSWAAPATASNTAIAPSANRIAMTLAAGKSRIYKPREAATRMSVADPAIADVMLLNPNELYILGKKTGSTNIFIWHDQERMSVIDITVGADTASARDLFAQLMPQEKKLKVAAAGDSLVLSGQVSDAMRVQQALQIAEELSGGKKVLNMLTTEDLPQILLEVKVAEVDREVSDKLGLQMQGKDFAFNMLGGAAWLGSSASASVVSGSTTTWLQAQMNSGLVKVLAEPNIMAISGQEGQFLSGGKVFMPVPQSTGSGGSVITLQEQNYGVGVKFVPTVLGGGRINLKVRPEVSEISPTGFTVSAANGTSSVLPQIVTRQASTTVQLYDGQTLAIGGLIKNNVVEVVSAFPFLANVPIIGALFRSASFTTNRSELVILVTPHIVKPLQERPPMPTDGYKQPSAADFFLGGTMEGSYKLPEPTTGDTTSMPNLGGAK